MKIGRALSNYQPAFHQSHAVSKCFHRKGKGHGGVFKIEAKKFMYQYVIYNMGIENKPKTNRYGFLLTSKKTSHVVRLSCMLFFSFCSACK